MSDLTPQQLRTAKIIGGVIGVIISMVVFVVIPMASNYADHGSVFIRQAAHDLTANHRGRSDG